MQNAFLTSRDRKPVDLTPIKILFAVLAISLVGIFTDVSAMTPMPRLFHAPFSKIKKDQGYSTADSSARLCGDEKASKTSCFLSEGGLSSGNALCPFSNSVKKPFFPSVSAKVRRRES